ncbi:MAG: sigma-70 family RNA polymerase sigma factor [Planctomycetota bacterium]
MCLPGSFDEAIGRLRDGDEDAAAEIFNRFVSRLICLAQTRLDSHLRRKVDPEDVMQSVFRSFFIRQREGRFELEGWDSLWSLLARITLRKCGRRITAFHAQCRDIRREIASTASDEASQRRLEAIAREPTPDEVASLTETMEHLMRGLDERQQQIVVLRFQGHTVPEISREVGRTQRTVHRVLGHVREALKRLEEQVSS